MISKFRHLSLAKLLSYLKNFRPSPKNDATGIPFRPGQTIIPGELVLTTKIAEHGMGTVWEAENLREQRRVVLKFPLKQTPMYAALLAGEFKSCEGLDHKHIVKVYGMRSLSEHLLCIEEEFINGYDFDVWRCEQPNGCFPWHEVKEYAMQIVDALAYAHSRDVCHRDVKPRNIMRVVNSGEIPYAKIIDFGIAAQRQIKGKLDAITSGAHTPVYASPQQIGGLGPHPSDDVYCFCATLYHLLTGCTVFEGIPRDLEEAIRYVPPPDPNGRLAAAALSYRIPSDVVKAIMRGLEKEVGQGKRPEDITQIGRLLGRAETATVLMGKRRWETGAEPRVRFARSGLMVIECLLESLGLNEFFKAKKLDIDYRPHKWDGKILQRIDERSLDGAVVNTMCAAQYIREHPDTEVVIVCDCLKSMNGQCFYLLGCQNQHPNPYSFSEIPQVLAGRQIFVNELPEHILTLNEFFRTIFPRKEGPSLIEIVDSNLAFQLLEQDPKALIYCGQNLRLIARQRDEYTEVLTFKDCPHELQVKLEKFTENCFVVNRKLVDHVGLDKLEAHCKRSQKAFANQCHNAKPRRDIIQRVAKGIYDYEVSDKEVQEAIEQVLVHTFAS